MTYNSIKTQELEALNSELCKACNEFHRKPAIERTVEEFNHCQELAKAFNLKAIEEAIEYRNLIDLVRDFEIPCVRVTQDGLMCRTVVFNDNEFVKILIDRADSSTVLSVLANARYACVGYVAAQEASSKQFKEGFKAGRGCTEQEFSKKACKRNLQDLMVAIFGEYIDGFIIKDSQVNSVLSKINSTKAGESVFAKSDKAFLKALIPMIRAYIMGTEIKQRFSSMTKEEKASKVW